MARRDVDLVIRAKDESSKAVDAITAALNELASGISSTEKKVSASDSAFAKLGKSLSSLDKAMKGMSSAEQLGQQLDRAVVSSTRLEQAASDAAKEVDRLSGEMAEAAQKTAQYNDRLAKTTENLEKEKAALKANSAAMSASNKELTAARNARSQLATSEKNLTATLATQEARLAKQQERLAQVTAEFEAADTPTKRLASSVTSAGVAMQKTAGQIAATKAALDGTKSSLAQAAQAEAQLTTVVAAGQTALEAQRNQLTQLKAARTGQAQEARQAAASERQLAAAQREASVALAASETGAAKANEALDELVNNAAQAELAIRDLAKAAQGPLSDAYRAQQAAVSRINNAFQQNRKDLAALSALMGQLGVPTREMSEQMDRLNRVNREVATAYREESAVLRTLRTELQQTASSTTELAAKQQLFATAVNQGSAALGRITSEVSAAGAATQRIITDNQRAAQSYRQVSSAGRQAASSADGLADANDRASESYRRQANASRQSMSYVQRLRGEVLSLVSSYGGLFAVINVLDQTVKAYQKLEAAQSRLNALTGGNQRKTADELDFIRRNADRLGIEFGALADEYTKFAASTKNTILEGQKTRDVFIAIAEAGVVNRLSLDNLNGILKATTQIASKGKIQLEELTGQLGDRLPGALQILADGLGITTEELLDLTKNGEVTSASLVNFAQELQKRYGPALGSALAGTTVYLGQLQNAATQALLAFANAGFIDGFNNLLVSLIETMRSADFLQFAANAGAAFGTLADALAIVARNFDLTVAGLTAFAGAALIPGVLRFGQSLLVTAGILRQVETGAKSAAAGIAATGAASAATAGRLAGLVSILRGLFSTTGVGLVLTAVATGISYWATQADEASTAMLEHQRIVDEVKNTYDKAAGSAGKWADKIKETTKLDAVTNLEKLTAALKEAREEYAGELPYKGLIQDKDFKELERLDQEFRDGKISVANYRKALSDLYDRNEDEGFREQIKTFSEAAAKLTDLEKATNSAQKIVTIYTGTADEAKAATDELTGATDKGATAFDEAAANAQKYKDALSDVKDFIPGLKAEMTRLKNEGKLSEIFGRDGFNAITPELFKFGQQATEAIQIEFSGDQQKAFKEAFEAASDTGKLLLQTAQKFDGFNENNPAQRDTLTDFFKQAKGGASVDPKITAWCAAFVNAVLATNGMPGTGALNARSFLNYGSETSDPKPGDVVVLKRGKDDKQGHVGFFMGFTGNGGVNVLGGNQDGAQAVSTSQFKKEDILGFRRPPSAADVEKDRAKNAKDTADSLAAGEAAISQQTLINAGKERQAAIEKRIAEEKAKNPDIDAATLQAMGEQEGRLYDIENAQKIANKPKEAAQKAEEEVNNLLAKQQALREQIKLLTAQGDYAGATALKGELEGVNGQLTTAIDNATKMWEAVKGTESEAAIAQLKAAKLESDALSMSAKQNLIDWTRVGELFVSGLTSAFDQFAQAVAEGTNIGEAARDAFLKFASDFLIQIGQMIVQQALLNALRSLGGPFASLGLGSGGFASGHTGGVVGSKRIGGAGNATRHVSPLAFMSAPRFHNGTAAPLGVRRDELPAILKKNEEVLDSDDPRNILNGGAAAGGGGGPGGAAQVNLKVNNYFDAAEVVSQGMASEPGEQAFLNLVKSNRGTIRDLLE